ncbi:LysR family transcriptional regulator [Pantoea cypripedii]|uniref:LysR family transcriptional regulator n=1 Tax=Pantoea cypripedii TaxID=55209 RepID=A0A6B9G5D3_PANCY|nr:LysR family transcriptional regulator [Pantoea cypripedii]QGY32921.1 LysR family transcriptional regulator [Pantoea cypripedii]
MKQPTLNDLNAFIAVATHLNFRRAADLLGVSHSALSHAMRALENNLGTRLLNRTTRSVSLTQDGERLLASLIPALSNLDSVLSEVAATRGNPSGVVRINATEGAIGLLLQTIVPRFHHLYPDVELELVAEGQLIDIVERGFDAGVRFGDAIPKDMVAVRLGPDVRFLAVASPNYLDQFTAPQVPDDLHQHRCIRQRLPSGKRYRWEFMKHDEEVNIDVPGVLTLNSNHLMVQAAADGLGIAYVPEFYASDLLNAGRLIPVLKDWCPVISGLFIYFPNNRHMPPGLRALIDVIKESPDWHSVDILTSGPTSAGT